MKQYYVDNRNGNLITMKEIKQNNLSPIPIGYYQFRNSGMEGLYIETWYCGGGKYLDYAYDIETIRNSWIPFYIQRQSHFEKYGVKMVDLYAYAVPPSEYKSNVEKYERMKKEI
ncbi:MAG: hypothetical protein J6R59_10390 [Paludibacteraceae bacterium]|nr:hypothetical protein [Paludibacteraceae bacterium]